MACRIICLHEKGPTTSSSGSASVIASQGLLKTPPPPAPTLAGQQRHPHPNLLSTFPPSSASPMDYSASVHDADHPTGASPWGSSPAPSPHADRTTFGEVAGAPPASPPRFDSDVPSNGFAADHEEEEGFGPSDHGFGRPGTGSTVSESDTQTHATDTASGDAPPGHQHGNVSPLQPHDPNRLSGDTARASQEQPQIRKPTQPVYKLQAKITGLERAARKDPILRFDVHVSLPIFYWRACANIC